MSLQEVFINNLRRIRKEKKITQEKLAELCQTDTSYIGQIEIGKRFPSITLIEKITQALDTPAYVFFKAPASETIYYEMKSKEETLQLLDNISKYIEQEKKELNQDKS